MKIGDINSLGLCVSRGVPVEYITRKYAEQHDLDGMGLKNDKPMIVKTRYKKEKINGAWAYVTNVAGERLRKNVAYIPFLTEKGEQVIYCTTSRKITSLIDILGYEEVGNLEETGEVTKTAKGVITGNIAIDYVEMEYGERKYPVPCLVERNA